MQKIERIASEEEDLDESIEEIPLIDCSSTLYRSNQKEMLLRNYSKDMKTAYLCPDTTDLL